MKIKAILDTNVVVSGIFWKGNSSQILKAWQRGEFILAISPPILDEYRRVLVEMTTRHLIPVVTSILKLIELHSEMVEPVSFAKHICSDPDDDKFLEVAVAARADYVVSGDRALLALKSYRDIEIVRPAQFLQIVSG